MPRLRQTAEEEMDEITRKYIRSRISFYGMKTPEVARMLGVSKSTVDNRKKDPSKMTIEEFRKMIKKWNFTAKEVCQMLGVPYQGGM